LKIFDAMGRIAVQQVLTDSSTKISVSTIKSGIYNGVISNNEGTITFKFVKN
jgi:hypothetical protein